MGRRGSCVRSSLSSLSSLLSPPSSRKISRSNLAYPPPEVERKAIRPAYWTRPGEIRFSRIFRVGQNDGRDRRALKRERPSFSSRLENWSGEITGGGMECVCFLPSSGRGKAKRGACSSPLAEDSPRTVSLASFQSFAAVPPEFVARINHGSYPGIDPLCRLHLNKGWNETKVARFCRVFLFSSSFFQIIIFVNDKINNIICLEIVFKNYIFKRGNVSIKTRVWVLTLSIIERYRKGYSLEMWCIYIYARTETRKRLRHIRNKRRRILI